MPFLLVANNILKRYISVFVIFEEEIQKSYTQDSIPLLHVSLSSALDSKYAYYYSPKRCEKAQPLHSAPAFTNFSISSLEIVYSWSYERPCYILPSGCGHLCSPHS